MANDGYVFNRRRFIQGTLGTLGSFMFVDSALKPTLTWAQGVPNPHHFVLIELSGGYAGSVPIVPRGQEGLYRDCFPTLGAAEAGLLQVNSNYSVGGYLSPLQQIWQAGHMRLLTDAGLTDSATRDHAVEQARVVGLLGVPSAGSIQGWINKALQEAAPAIKAYGIGTGGSKTDYQGDFFQYRPVVVSSLANFNYSSYPNANNQSVLARNFMQRLRGVDQPSGEMGRRVRDGGRLVDSAIADMNRINQVNPGTHFDSQSSLMGHVRAAAQIILDAVRTGSGGTIIRLEYGGWDNHANMNLNSSFNNRVNYVARCIRALWDCMRANGMMDKVTILALSEFGRTAENRSEPAPGTDHGHGNQLIAVSGAFRPGSIDIGPTNIARLKATNACPVSYDIRNFYADMFEHFYGLDPAQLLKYQNYVKRTDVRLFA